ncbi:hypothetical protein ACFE04_007044 [Oxalis oulophora]
MKSNNNYQHQHQQQQQQQRLETQINLHNIISNIFIFCTGLIFGVTLNFYLKNISVNFQLNQFSSNLIPTPTTPPPPPPRTQPPPSPSPPPPPSPSVAVTSRIGLNDYLKPPKINHDMKEEELLWRASLVPSVKEYPFKRVKKVAFMFLTKGPVVLAPLWEKFFKGHQGFYSIYVHSTPDFHEDLPETSIFYNRRIPSKEVQWGMFNMIEAERRLLANALLDISNEQFVLLSESCIPLFNFTTIYNHLMKSTKTFVESYDMPGPVGRGRYTRKMSPTIKLNQWRKGSQWFQMDRQLAVQVVSDTIYFETFKKNCKPPCYSDEHYLPTFVYIKFAKRNLNKTLTWVDWEKGGPHPTNFRRARVNVGFLEWLRSDKKFIYNLLCSD